MTISQANKWATEFLEKKGIEEPKSSADFLIRQTLKVDKSYLIVNKDKKMPILVEAKFRRWIKRRAKHEPVWYITGKIEFYGQDFYVNKNVLIPRPETELLVEEILKRIKTTGESRILDIGTGSGAIILTLANKLKGQFFASDISDKALVIAKKNAKSLTHHNKVIFKKGDLLSPWLNQKFDLIVANLPYVPHEDMSTLAFDLIHYEPRTALDGGTEGLELYNKFIQQLPFLVNDKTTIFCEIGKDQGEKFKRMVINTLPKASVEIIQDYAKIDRIIVIKV